MEKKFTKDQIREKLLTEDAWLYRGLLAIYRKQTSDEQNSEVTRHHNSIGFTGADAAIMTSMAKQLMKRGSLTERQKAYLRNGKSERFPSRIGKYAGQLAKIANGQI